MFTRPKVLLFYEKHVWDYLPGTPNRTISGFYAWYLSSNSRMSLNPNIHRDIPFGFS